MGVCRMLVCLRLYLKSPKHIARFKQNMSRVEYIAILSELKQYSLALKKQ